ncbi:TonB-dependent receptor domain-containing protein [Frigidibacter sp.]|uniref:TonB-dependent receptor domain-containing protein n=1 Tax=Frigidibacter sp. TaxID=2586418 RepID=UPI002733A422|nr:TonB-dependent receptor [Frigidibacter sp.]MDP3340406.1 TonB-dependent receptor [Frigidibacter sp.]
MRPSNRHLAAVLLGTTCLTLAAAPLAAQETIQLDTIVIVGYDEDGAPIFAGENTTSLDADDLQSGVGVTDVNSILRRQTSVFTQQDPGNPGIAVNLRGFEGSGRVAMSVDGVPQQFRLTGHAAQSAAFVDENFLSGVEIIRGAVTTTGGTGIAGSVNLSTIDAKDVVRDGQKFGGISRLTYGDNGENHSGMAAIAYRDDRFDMLLGYSRHLSEDYEDGDGDTVANTDEDVVSTLFKLGYNIDASQRVTFMASRYDTSFFATSYDQELTSDIYKLGYSYDAGDNLIDLKANLYRADTETEWVGGTGSYVGRKLSTETTGFDLTNTSRFAFGNWSLTSINGLEISQDDLGGKDGGVNPTDGTADRASIFSENIFVNGKWELTAGLRANEYALDGEASQGEIDITNRSVDPKLTVAYRVTDWLQPYATVSRTMRSPTLQETMLGGTHPGGGTSMIANPELEAETSQGYEIGFNLDSADLFASGDSLTGRVNYYRMDVDDYVVTAFGFRNAFGQVGTAFANVDGTSETSGVEVELAYSYRQLDLGLSYTKNDSDIPSQTPGLGAGQYLPDSTLSASIAGRFLQDRMTLGAEYSFVSGGLYTGLYQQVPVQRDDSYELVDLFASYKLNDSVQLNAKIENAFDTDYTPWLSSGEKGQGRTLYVGTSLQF